MKSVNRNSNEMTNAAGAGGSRSPKPSIARVVRFARRGGFTLIELLVAVIILSIVTAGVYQLYITQYRHSISQDLRSEMLQRVRVALNDMTRDMQMAGFKPRVDAINGADAPQFTFEHLNNLLSTQPAGFTKDRRITYRFDAGADRIMKRVQIWNTTDPNPDKFTNTAEEMYLENITNLTFAYFDVAGTTMAVPVAAGDLGKIRRVDITLTAETSDIDPVTKDRRTITLTTQVFPRNMGIEESTLDQTCPATPTGLAATDPNACGQIDLAWNANTEADLAGYRINYGVLPGLYSGSITVGTVTSATLDGLADGTTHYIAIGSFDEASNACALSLEVTGTGPGNPDTTPDPGTPQQTLSLDATSSAAGVSLTWNANSASYPASRPDSDANVDGYNIYRSSDAGSTYTKIVDEHDGQTYLDVPGPSLSCIPLWYKVEPVNCMDVAGPQSAAAYGDGSGLNVDAPQSGITSTIVDDSSPPSTPANLISKSGFKRNYLVWDNPGDADFSHVIIRYSTTTFPASPLDGSPVENAPDGSGRFEGNPNQTMTFTHDGGTVPPSLSVNTTYFYTVFAYDACGNVSSAQASAQTAAAQCGDEPLGPSAGLPPAPTLPSTSYINSCDTDQAVIRWDLVDDTFPNGVFDLAGYNVYRATNNIAGPYIKQNGSILFGTYPGIRAYTDTTVLPGNVYYYKITATDCDWEVNGGVNGGGESPASPLIQLSMGDLIQSEENPDVLSSGPHHERVIFWIKNMKDSPVNKAVGQIRLKSLRLDYENVVARVATITRLNDFNDPSDDDVLYSDGTEPIDAGSGTDIALSGAVVLDGQEDVAIAIGFVTASGSVSDSMDMRDDIITVNWAYENVATSIDNCGVSMDIDVPFSPAIKSVVQDQPISPMVSNITPGVVNVLADQMVNVLTFVSDPDAQGINEVKLFWKDTNKSDIVPPATGWSEQTMTDLGGGNYALTDAMAAIDDRIPARNNKRIWYFIVVTDSVGNYDRAPVQSNRAFTYDQ